MAHTKIVYDKVKTRARIPVAPRNKSYNPIPWLWGIWAAAPTQTKIADDVNLVRS